MGGTAFFPPLAIPLAAIELYAAQTVLNNTKYKSFKDLAFVAGKKGKNIKIYQDVVRPDISKQIIGLDKREKLGFLQLQALVGMTKFDELDRKGNPQTIETDSHGIIRNTFQKLNELGYLQNYTERHIKDSRLIMPKLAFANTEINKKVPIYNMTFQKSSRQIDFEDPSFRRMFPLVFSKRGILAKRGYTLEKDEEGRIVINYGKGKPKEREPIVQEKTDFRERIREEESLESQKQKIEQFMKKQNLERPNQTIHLDKEE